jgi:hypothetical protein
MLSQPSFFAALTRRAPLISFSPRPSNTGCNWPTSDIEAERPSMSPMSLRTRSPIAMFLIGIVSTSDALRGGSGYTAAGVLAFA